STARGSIPRAPVNRFSSRLTTPTVSARSPPHIVSDDDPASYPSRTPDPPGGHPVLPPVDREISARATVNRRRGRRQRGPLLGPCGNEPERTDGGAAKNDAPSFEPQPNTGQTRRGRAVMTIKELTERRELAHRTNDGFDVTLFWSKASNRVTVSVFHARS